jgi:crotonobetainyl-CoA:carnitine CoA-transferase CaiB-like acyl-CoA transferase
MASRPLEGLLVVAIEQAVAAPTCTVRLADAGARVIKIERPEGETARHYDAAVNGTSAYFAWLNRGKESIVLDLKAKDDLELAKRMVARADVFIQNLAPGASTRLGLGAMDLTARYPRLIVVDIVGYGQDTASKDMRAYDMLVQAEAGICAVTGTPETPCKVGVSIADVGTGMNAYTAVLEALLERGRTGRGQAIEVAMFDSMADWMAVPLLHYDYQGRETPRAGLSHASIYPYATYRCTDGEVVLSIQNPAEWRRFCATVLRRPELADDPLYATNPLRVKNRPLLEAILNPYFAAMTREQMIGLLTEAEIAWSRVSTIRDLASHPALRRITVPGESGDFSCVAPPTRRNLRPGPVPRLGQHSDAVRMEFSGTDRG